jgi:hypothetical protein
MKNKEYVSLLWFVVLDVLVMSCARPSSPPYVVTRPVFVTGERSGYYHYAGIEFFLLNSSGTAISETTVSFALFDAQTGENPLAGSNKFSLTILEVIDPDEKKEIIIPLDDYIYIAPARPYTIDFFYISKIVYADGSLWTDTWGTYHTGSQL